MDIEWVPRSLNEKADYLSKIVDYDDWELAPEFFQQLDELWGPFTVDCFATHYNRKVPKYFQDFGILRQPELKRFSKTGNTKIA